MNEKHDTSTHFFIFFTIRRHIEEEEIMTAIYVYCKTEIYFLVKVNSQVFSQN